MLSHPRIRRYHSQTYGWVWAAYLGATGARPFLLGRDLRRLHNALALRHTIALLKQCGLGAKPAAAPAAAGRTY